MRVKKMTRKREKFHMLNLMGSPYTRFSMEG